MEPSAPEPTVTPHLEPFGHRWSVATHKQILTPEEIAANAAAVFSKPGCG
jgi:hypothetical protein